jgi:hypothetical protein
MKVLCCRRSNRLPISQPVELYDEISDPTDNDEFSWRPPTKCMKRKRQPFFLFRGDDVIVHPRE